MLPGNIDFSNEQHSAVSIGISYFKFKIIPGKLFGDGEENFSFSELGLIISGYVWITGQESPVSIHSFISTSWIETSE